MQYFLEFQQGAPGSAVLHRPQLRFGVFSALQGGGEVVFGVGDGVAELMASAERHGRRFFLFMAALSAPSYACIARGIARRNFSPWCPEFGGYVVLIECLCTTGWRNLLDHCAFVDSFSFVRKCLFYGFFIFVNKK